MDVRRNISTLNLNIKKYKPVHIERQIENSIFHFEKWPLECFVVLNRKGGGEKKKLRKIENPGTRFIIQGNRGGALAIVSPPLPLWGGKFSETLKH